MPRHQTPAQRETVERVMHEFKHGELKTAARQAEGQEPETGDRDRAARGWRVEIRKPGGEQAQPAPNQSRRSAAARPTRRGRGAQGPRQVGQRPQRHRKDQGRTLRRSEKARHPGALEDEQAAARTGAARIAAGSRCRSVAPVRCGVLQVRKAGGVAIGAQAVADPHLAAAAEPVIFLGRDPIVLFAIRAGPPELLAKAAHRDDRQIGLPLQRAQQGLEIDNIETRPRRPR